MIGLSVILEMNDQLALAGLAEAGGAMALVIAWAGLLIAGLFLLIALWRVSWIFLGVSIGFWAFVTLLFAPWLAFIPVSTTDPDVVYWAGAAQIMAAGWAALGLGCAFAARFVARSQRRRGANDLRQPGTKQRGFPVIQKPVDPPVGPYAASTYEARID